MKKIFIINGPGRSGKRSFINAVRCYLKPKNKDVYVFTSIFPVKKALFDLPPGHPKKWDGRKKTEQDRNNMIDLKAKMIAKGDKPNKYLIEKIRLVDDGIFFVQIREKSEIERFIELAKKELGVTPRALHYEREGMEIINTTAETQTRFYNNYDYEIVVGEGLENVLVEARNFIKEIFGEETIETLPRVDIDDLSDENFHEKFDDELEAGFE